MSQVTVEQALQIGIQHHQAGQLQEAENVYRQILLHQPNHADSLHLLGLISHQRGQHQAAIDLMGRALVIRPNWPEARHNLAIAVRASAEVFNNLGVVLQTKGELQQAISAYRNAIAQKADYSEAYANLSIALRQSGQLDEAITACRQAVALNPHSLIAHDNLGLAMQEKGEIDQAILAHRQALALNPNSAPSAFNLANALNAKGLLDDAIETYRLAIAIRPDYAAACNNLGKALIETGQVADAVAAFDRARLLKPENAAYDSAFIFALHYQTSDPKVVAEEHFRWGRRHASRVDYQTPSRVADRRLRIGYVSPDFRNHPVGRFLLPLLLNHDHQQFEIFCYSDVVRADVVTTKFQSVADHWREIASVKHEAVADQIRADGIDILVDLTGHTTGSRLLVFAQKPAPLQVSYLGYPGTTGMSEIDYRLTDSLADPIGMTEHLHTETLYRLPKTNWCFAADETDSPVEPSPFLRNRYITFGSFNNFSKVTDEMLQTWGRILQEVPNSRLLLKSAAFASAKARERVGRMFADRVTLLGPQPDHATHLATYNQIDISLDTFPYHGTTTTCESLWMGVPVITLAGQSHLSRVGLSLLTNVGLPEWVATMRDQYIHLAVALAGDADRLHHLRQTLRERMRHSPLMDAPDFASNLEAAFGHMWQQRKK